VPPGGARSESITAFFFLYPSETDLSPFSPPQSSKKLRWFLQARSILLSRFIINGFPHQISFPLAVGSTSSLLLPLPLVSSISSFFFSFFGRVSREVSRRFFFGELLLSGQFAFLSSPAVFSFTLIGAEILASRSMRTPILSQPP